MPTTYIPRPVSPARKEALATIRARSDRRKAVKQSEVYRDFPDTDGFCNRRAVCKRCHCVMNDCEPHSSSGEYHHPSRDKNLKPYKCVNAGLSFTQRDLEIEPFLRKGDRARNRRNGVRP